METLASSRSSALLQPCKRCIRYRAAFQAASKQRFVVVLDTKTRAEVKTEKGTTRIEGTTTTYCDDFVCKSSPAVEQSIRTLCSNIRRLGLTSRILSSDVQYSDGLRSSKGAEQYTAMFWLAAVVAEPVVEVESVRMVDTAAAEVAWKLRGRVANADLRLACRTNLTMNPLTGRIVEHRDEFSTAGSSPIAAAAFTVQRVLSALNARGQAAGAQINKITDSLSSMDDDDMTYYGNPSDPTRFFQQNRSQERNDLFLYAGIAIILYAFVQAYLELEKLH